ncbi:MAG: ATP-binding cassette domain-containing protein [Pseudomonadota bacterium]
MIELQQIEKTYTTGDAAFKLGPIDLSIKAGEIFGIIGKSGAGKSTLVRQINLLERPNAGKVVVDGMDLMQLNAKNLRAARKKITMIFQHFNLLQSRSVLGNIKLAVEVNPTQQQTQAHSIEELLELTGLAGKQTLFPHQLSGGQKQRVAIARALVTQPKVLLCDEATSALDPETTKNILKLLNDINQRFNLTIVLITHEMQVIKQICDRVAVLDQGKLVEQNNIFEFFTHPQSAAGKTLVDAYIAQEFPAHIKNKITPKPSANCYPLLRIFFFGKSAESPIIASLIKNFQVEIDIIQANIETIKSETLGIMTFAVLNQFEKLTAMISFIEKHRIRVEVLGYVKRDA